MRKRYHSASNASVSGVRGGLEDDRISLLMLTWDNSTNRLYGKKRCEAVKYSLKLV